MTSITFLGDIMVGRLVVNKQPIEEDVLHFCKDSGLRVANLECVITEKSASRSQLRQDPKHFMCKHGAKFKQAEVLKTMNIDCCNLANNHILDYDFDGVKDSIQWLNENHIKWFGFGKNLDVAWKPRIVKLAITDDTLENKKDIFKIALFGLADHFVEWKADTGPGINFFDIGSFLNEEVNLNRAQWQNVEVVEQQIEKVLCTVKLKLCPLFFLPVRSSTDLIVFSIHWGDNFQKKVCQTFQEFAHVLIDMGVDIIHGHSTHHFQGVEIYKGKLILYGCGDFINDYDLYEDLLQSVNESLGDEYIKFRSDLGFIYKVYVEKVADEKNKTIRLQKLEMMPISIHRGSVQLCSDEDRKEAFDRMSKACKQFETKLTVGDGLMVVHIK